MTFSAASSEASALIALACPSDFFSANAEPASMAEVILLMSTVSLLMVKSISSGEPRRDESARVMLEMVPLIRKSDLPMRYRVLRITTESVEICISSPVMRLRTGK